MTVKQLIRRLKKMPENSTVIFPNTDMVINGAYTVTDVVDWGEGTVLLDTNHKKNYWEEE